MSVFSIKINPGFITSILFFSFTSVMGQQLLDDFGRSDSGTVGNGWTEGGTSSTGAIVSNELDFGTNSTNGQDYISQDVSSLYTTILDYSTSTVTWAVNMSQSRSNPSGFNSGNYGIAFVLGATSSDFTTGNGYAVLFGESGGTDPIRLVHYSGGLDLNSNITDIISGNDYGTEHLNIRVTFNPSGDNWSLYVESGGSFSDPTAVTTQIGSTTSNSTYTTSSLDFVGCYYNHSNGGGEDAQFDNFYVPSTPVVKAEPTNHPSSFTVSSTGAGSATVTWIDATGAVTPDFYLIKGSSTSYAAITDPIDGTFEPDITLVQNVAQGTQTATLTGLTENTTYYFQIYSYSNTGSNVNYKTDGSIQQASDATIALPTAWINELHYDDTGSDADEFVEIVIEFPGSYTLSDFTVTLYNGADGSAYDTRTVDNFTAGTAANNYTPYTFNYTNNSASIENGAPDGLALSYQGILIQLLSYEGTFTATDGDANGILSEDIGVDEDPAPANGSSLYLSGTGNAYSDFTWAVSTGSNTLGTENTSQTLPVELVKFEIFNLNNDNSVLLEWETATELNNDYFEIQRSSSGEDFIVIGNVKGVGNSNNLVSYSFKDIAPLNGANYYRLKQVDFDGSFAYSNVKYISVANNNDPFIVFPNPTTGNIVLKIGKSYIANYSLKIFNTNGELIKSTDINIVNKIEINLPKDISQGIYFIELSSKEGVWRKRIIKK